MSSNLLLLDNNNNNNNNAFNTMEQQDEMNPTPGSNMPDNAASFQPQQMQMMMNANNNNNGMMSHTAGYPALLQQYFMQQQQQQQLLQMQHQAADHGQGDPNLASLMGLMSGGQAGLAGAFYQQQQQNLDALMLQQLQQQHQQQQQGGMLMPNNANMSDSGMMMAAAYNQNTNNNMSLGPWSATSASLLGKMAVGGTTMESIKTKAPRKRKDKNKPKRPLSAYNLFFKEERARILEGIPDPKGEEGPENDEVKKENEDHVSEQEDDDKKTKSSSKNKESSNMVGGKKRPHGKIGFESLAKTIGERWKNLEASKVEYYKKKAAEDTQRYKREMEAYLGKTSKLQQESESKDDSTTNDEDVANV